MVSEKEIYSLIQTYLADGITEEGKRELAEWLEESAQNREYFASITAISKMSGIKEMNAQNFVEFICTSNSTVMASSYSNATAIGVNIGWMADESASYYQQNSYKWANLSTEYMTQGGGKRTVEEFTKSGIAISVFNADNDATMNYYIKYASSMKAICTNYPKALIAKMR